MCSPSRGRNKWKEWRDRYVGALMAVSTFIPIPVFCLNALIYFSVGYFGLSLDPAPAVMVVLNLGITILGLLLLPLLFMRLATAEGGKLSDYNQICGDLRVLKDQVNEAKRIAPPSIEKAVETLTYTAIDANIDYIEGMLQQGGMIWVLRTGYIKVWTRIGQIIEAMMSILPGELVIENALQTIAQLSSSGVPNNQLYIERLEKANGTLRPAPNSSTSSVDEQPARSTIRQILYILHTYRCERWEELVRARNQTLGAAWLASWLLYALLDVAILAQVPKETMYQMSVFLLLGAIVGLFSRLLNEVDTNHTAIAHMDDYGLTVARIIVTPFLSGLAALVGVPLAVIAIAMLQGHSTEAATLLMKCYDFSLYPGNLLIAAAFGYLPSAVINLLKEQASRIQSELVSSSSSK